MERQLGVECAHMEVSLFRAGDGGLANLVQWIKNITYIEVDALLMDRHLRVECAHMEESLYGAGVEGVAEQVQQIKNIT
jgi:hypothetical protein